MNEIYLDNSATTKVCSESVRQALNAMTHDYGNPSSVHAKGFSAESILDNARKVISKILGCDKSELYFTSGGTESNNIAILGCVKNQKRYGSKIVTTNIEHSSVLGAMTELERQGFEVEYLKSDSHGMISKEQLYNAIDSKTILVSIMAINNEIGSILPINEVKNIVRYKKSLALFHVDAVQAFGKIPINVSRFGIDLLSISAHKIHGPKGVGALYISKNTKIRPIMFGGGQENGIIPGTEAVSAIAGFKGAVEELNRYNNLHLKVSSLNQYFRSLVSRNKNIRINSPLTGSPYILNISVKGIKAETMVNYLSSNYIYVSNGSACSKGNRSRILTAIGLSDDVIDSAIRISFSRYNTRNDVDILVKYINEATKKLMQF